MNLSCLRRRTRKRQISSSPVQLSRHVDFCNHSPRVRATRFAPLQRLRSATIAREDAHGQRMETSFGAKQRGRIPVGLEGARNLVDGHVGKGLRNSPHAKYAARAVSRARGGLPTNEPTPENLHSRGATMQQIFTGSYILLQLGLGRFRRETVTTKHRAWCRTAINKHYSAALAAFSISAATSLACERNMTWLPVNSTVSDLARRLMNRSSSGLIIRSCVETVA